MSFSPFYDAVETIGDKIYLRDVFSSLQFLSTHNAKNKNVSDGCASGSRFDCSCGFTVEWKHKKEPSKFKEMQVVLLIVKSKEHRDYLSEAVER